MTDSSLDQENGKVVKNRIRFRCVPCHSKHMITFTTHYLMVTAKNGCNSFGAPQPQCVGTNNVIFRTTRSEVMPVAILLVNEATL